MRTTARTTALFAVLLAAPALLAQAQPQAQAPAPAAAKSGGLVAQLTQQLGVTNDQAAGGAGALLAYAKDKLTKKDFQKVGKAIPETPELLKAAPKPDDTTSSISGALSGLGGGGSSGLGDVGAMAVVGSSFQKLGLSPDMAAKFTPIVVNYAKTKGGPAASKLLSGVLSPKSESGEAPPK